MKIALFLFILMYGVFVQSLLGFGGTPLAMPLGILVMGLSVTKPVMTIVAMLTGIVLTGFIHDTYGARMTLVVASRSGDSYSTLDNNAANHVANTFAELLNTDLVRERLASDAGYSGFNGTLKVTVQEDTNLVNVSLSAPTAKQAYKLMDSFCNNYQTLSSYISASGVITQLNAPNIYKISAVPMARWKIMALAALAGMVLMLAFVVLVFLGRGTIQTETAARELLDSRLLETFNHEKKKKGHYSLRITEPTVSFSYSESIQKLSAMLEQKQRELGGNTFMISSVCENEGKSTIAENIALALLAHNDGGVPNVVIEVRDRSAYSFGYLVYFFELACAISGYMLGVNPFDQPGVEAYKNNMYALLGKPGYEEERKVLEARMN